MTPPQREVVRVYTPDALHRRFRQCIREVRDIARGLRDCPAPQIYSRKAIGYGCVADVVFPNRQGAEAFQREVRVRGYLAKPVAPESDIDLPCRRGLIGGIIGLVARLKQNLARKNSGADEVCIS